MKTVIAILVILVVVVLLVSLVGDWLSRRSKRPAEERKHGR